MYSTHVISAISEYMISNPQTLAVAESVTSRHLQAALSVALDASKFFHGGITTYN
jgi:nicotinamide-nucleotide amidase